jgi:hypothetical protein
MPRDSESLIDIERALQRIQRYAIAPTSCLDRPQTTALN